MVITSIRSSFLVIVVIVSSLHIPSTIFFVRYQFCYQLSLYENVEIEKKEKYIYKKEENKGPSESIKLQRKEIIVFNSEKIYPKRGILSIFISVFFILIFLYKSIEFSLSLSLILNAFVINCELLGLDFEKGFWCLVLF